MSAQPLCPVCQDPEHFAVDYFGEFTFLRCSKCTLEFCDPMQYETSSYDAAYKATEETDFYVPSVKWLREASPNLAEARWMLFAAQKEALTWLGSKHTAGSILDIGCGPGWFLIRAHQLGFEVSGVEIGSEPVRVLQEKGYDVVCGSVESVPPNWTPQVITLFEVLEHLPDPVKFLAQIKNRFPQSQLIVTVPSPRRWTKAGHHRDLADFPPNHLTRWNPYSLMRALSLAGYGQLEVSYSKPIPLETAAVSIRGLWKSWTGEMPDRLTEATIGGPLRHLKSEIMVRKLKCIPGFVGASLFRLLGWSGISMLAIATPQ
jgi:SAM-dependent methyltransferase